MEHSSRYIVLFAAAVCGVCSIFVSLSAVMLKDRQEENKRLDVQQKVLAVAGLMGESERLSKEEVAARYSGNIVPRIVDLATGGYASDVDVEQFDQREAASDPERSREAPPNPAKVRRIPQHAVVYQVVTDGELLSLILPIEGKGLWSTLYGFISLGSDSRTIQGITFYQHGETPGLGGEVDNPRWKALWKGRKAFDEQWKPRIQVKKGTAGSPEEDPYQVDGLSGATITSRSVGHLVSFWLGDDGFGPYLARYRSEGEI